MTPYYQDESVTIYHADALDIASELPRVDLVLTDPPFLMPAQHYASRKGWQRSWGDTSILARWWDGVLTAMVDRLKETGHFVTFCDDESYPVFYPGLYARFDVLNALVWDKAGIGMGSTWRHSHEFLIAARWKNATWTATRAITDILRVPIIPSADRHHPVDKPPALLAQIIEPTTMPNALVLDPFLGGGSTLIAAKMLGRKAIGIEIDERYCDVAAQRLSQETLGLSA